jgi:TonB family protein
MARQFGEGEHKVLLIMDQFAPGDSFKLMFIGESVMPKHRIRPINAALQFGPAEQESAITGIEGLFDKQRSFIVNGGVRIAPFSPAEEEAVSTARRNETYFEPRPIEASREKAATWIALKELMEFDLVLHTGPMDKPMNALRECSWDLLGDWGLDVATQKSLSRKATPKGGVWRWISGDDYPLKMLNNSNEGIVHVGLIVDEQGKPIACHVQSSTRPKEFDDVVCSKFMKRGKFNPALDANGKPVRSYFQTTVNFRLG